MKKLAYILFMYLISTLFISNTTLAATCDQVFEGNMIRYNKGYNFSDTWNNGSSNDVYINNFVVDFENPAFLDSGAKFDFTSELVANDHSVDARDSMKIIKTGSPWRVAQKPVIRSNATRTNNDFMIKYIVTYDFSNNFPNTSDDVSHSECQYFSVTWCGDGVKDGAYEQCDPNDITKTSWGTGGCSNTCTILIAPKVCGDGTLDTPNDSGFNEKCDDGNLINADGCSSTCTIEPPKVCGDGTTDTPNDAGFNETCDDGNLINGDGCSSVCTIEIPKVCGDGTTDRPNDAGFMETCDDGNLTNGDGCSSLCTIENIATTCGDGTIQSPNDDGIFETCDDGNLINGDGCSSVCRIEIVTTTCGDGTIQSPNDDGVFETCDDGNLVNGDGCSSACTIEIVTTTCGDGTIQSPNDDGVFETCDDGNLINGDRCSSVCTIEPFVPSITIDKTDGNNIDLDGIIGTNDSQLISSGSLSVFKITVTNNGTDDLNNMVISDTMAGSCGGTIPLPALPATFMSGSLTGSGNHADSIFQIGETLEYYCDSNTPAPYVNTITINAIGILSGNPANDSDISGVLLQTPTPEIDIIKIDANANDLDLDIGGNDTQTVNSGALATFGITVTNNGTENLNNVVISDPLVAACSRTNAETAVSIQAIGNLDIVFDIGETFTYNCTDPVVTANYTNIIGVTAIGIGTIISVDDLDTSDVVIFIAPVIPICTNLTVSQNSARNTPYTPTYNCTASGPTPFQVTLTNPNGNVITDQITATGSFPLINIVGTYTARCFVEGGLTTTPSCIKTLNYSTGGGGGGGGSTTCRSGIFTASTATCVGSSRARYMRYICENGKELIKTGNNVNFSITDCNDGLDPLIDPMASRMNYTNAKCEASKNSTSWTSRKACEYDPGGGGGGGGGGPYCGDGVVQRPNRSGFMEECDSSAGCNACKLEVITIPGNVNIKIDRVNEHYIIGNTMDLYDTHTLLRGPSVRNLSDNYDDDYYIPEICAYIKSGNSLAGELKCQNVGMLYSPKVDGEKNSHYFGGPFNYIGSTTGLGNGITQGLNKVAYTLGDGSNRPIRGAYFEEIFDVSVIKPTITTTGGGINYVKNQNAADLQNISNVKDTSGNIVVSNNYVGTGIGDDLSSSSKDGISNSESLKEGLDLENIVNEKIESITTVDWVNYNGMDNVYYVQSDFDITSIFDINTNPINRLSDTESKTYIIEGDLTISKDISGYPGSLAFIVKGGNIIIRENVKNIQGTYIALADSNGYNGNINGDGVTTNNVLHVKGSMYGDNSDLLSKRTYIKNNSQGQIDVGTIISFGSSVFRKPAPLTTKFINDYLETTKVAQ